MSKHETPMTVAYLESVGGTLIEEYRVVDGTAKCSWRDVDAIILPKLDRRRVVRAERRNISLKD